jgi:hypothetical protein
MGPKTRDGDGSAKALDDALDRLYAAPLDGFVALRRELVATLRASGDVPASRALATATKPSRTAWALNQVVRSRPELVTALLEAHTAAAAEQTAGDSDSLRATARTFRERLGNVVQAAGEILRDAGGELSGAQGRRVAETLRAMLGAEGGEGRAKMLAGRLVADEEPGDPFAGMTIGPTRPRAPREAPPPDELAPRRAAAEAARARAAEREREKKERDLAEARERVGAIEREAQDARAAARQAEIAASRAQAEAERARRAVGAVEQRLDEARRALRALGA